MAPEKDKDKKQQEDAHFQTLMLGLAENTGMHGLPNIRRSSGWFRKTFWLLILLAGLGKL